MPEWEPTSRGGGHIFAIMAVSIEQKGRKETVITVKGELDPAQLDQAIRHLRYLSLTRGFKKVSQAAADKLADEITASAHRKRQGRLAS